MSTQIKAALEAVQGPVCPEKSLHDALAECGVDLKFNPEPGCWYRITTDGSEDKSGQSSIRLKVYEDGLGAYLHDFKTGQNKYIQLSDQPLPETVIRTQTTERASKAQAEAEEAQSKASRIWWHARPFQDHPYLGAKGISNLWSRMTHVGDLVIPYQTIDRSLVALQFVRQEADGLFSKRFIKGSPTKGAFGVIGRREGVNQAVLCEGFATAVSLHECFGYPCVIYTGYADNLKPVAEALRKASSDLEIIIAADDDWMSGVNAGMQKAHEAAEMVGGSVIAPEWPSDRPKWATDFNDVVKLQRAGGAA